MNIITSIFVKFKNSNQNIKWIISDAIMYFIWEFKSKQIGSEQNLLRPNDFTDADDY